MCGSELEKKKIYQYNYQKGKIHLLLVLGYREDYYHPIYQEVTEVWYNIQN